VSKTDDEETKALIRTLHEATKDARIARREIQDERYRLIKDLQLAREQIGADYNEMAARVVEGYMDALNGALARHVAEINVTVANADETVKRCAADLAAMKDPGDFTAEVVARIGTDITKALDERFASLVEEFFRGEADAKQHRRRQRQKPPPATLFHPDHPIGIRLPNGGSGK
jgi:hypothetical protein